MRQLVREIIDVREPATLDGLLQRLSEIRARLPKPDEAVVRLRGDDFFGRMITITYSRPA
jgi:hypothetical protein